MTDARPPAAGDGPAATAPRSGRRATAEAGLSRTGLSAARAVPALRTLGVWSESGPAEGATEVVDALAAAASPDAALRSLTAIAERDADGWRWLLDRPDALRRAAVVAGVSDALGDLLAADAGARGLVAGHLEPWDRATARDHAAAAVRAASGSGGEAGSALAAVQRRGLLRVATRDLLGLADTRAASVELSALADGILAAALDHVAAGVGDDVRVAVVAMGKLGGGELNYVSDVDVIFVHDGDAAVAHGLVRSFLALAGGATPEGRPYEVDANLRPEGRDGPLTRTVDAYAAYYDRWAKTWERQALLKARAVAGDEALGAVFEGLVRDVVWNRPLDVGAVAEVQRMKGVVERSTAVRREGTRQLKLAPGGLRDIEFSLQLLQLVHGRHDPSLRARGTLEALEALGAGGYVDEGDANLFADAYTFLRTVEHRVQLRRLRRTHTIPAGDEDRQRLARAVGFRDVRAAPALAQFDRELARVQAAVRRLHEKLFYRPLLGRLAAYSEEERLGVRVDAPAQLDEDAARERLAALGFHRPGPALQHVEALAAGTTRTARLLSAVLPAVLEALAGAPDPDAGLKALRAMVERVHDNPAFLRVVRENPPVAALLGAVLGTGPVVGDWLARQPEVFNLLLDDADLAAPRTPEDHRELARGLARRARGAPAPEPLRRFRRREVARTAIRDLAGRAGVLEVAGELTSLAEACLEAAVATFVPDGVRLAVLGLGRFGGGELAYSSDLDVVLVFEPAERREDALRAAEEVLRFLSGITPEGQAWRVDPDLRPEGRDGPLARTLASTVAYYERWGEPWELQALTTARAVAGDRDLGDRVIEAVAPLVYPEVAPAERLAAVRKMKARVERERGATPRALAPRPLRPTGARIGRGASGPGRAWAGRATGRDAGSPSPGGARNPSSATADLKLGPGGLSDVEWTVQLLQLRHGGTEPALRGPGTVAAIAACAEAGLLDAEEAEWLRQGWMFVSRLRNRLFLAGHRRSDRVPVPPRELEVVARAMGFPRPASQAFLEALERHRRRVRRVHERRFYEQP